MRLGVQVWKPTPCNGEGEDFTRERHPHREARGDDSREAEHRRHRQGGGRGQQQQGVRVRIAREVVLAALRPHPSLRERRERRCGLHAVHDQ
jgi:hypothetical protein